MSYTLSVSIIVKRISENVEDVGQNYYLRVRKVFNIALLGKIDFKGLIIVYLGQVNSFTDLILL